MISYTQCVKKAVESLKNDSGKSKVYLWVNPIDYEKLEKVDELDFEILIRKEISQRLFYVGYDKNQFDYFLEDELKEG